MSGSGAFQAEEPEDRSSNLCGAIYAKEQAPENAAKAAVKAMRQKLGATAVNRNHKPKNADAFCSCKSKKTGGADSFLFNLWCKTKRAGFLPEGIPYKITDNIAIRAINGSFILGLNQPLILVSDLLNAAERKNAARHELIEWQRIYKAGVIAAHTAAKKAQNPRLRESGRRKLSAFVKKIKPENN